MFNLDLPQPPLLQHSAPKECVEALNSDAPISWLGVVHLSMLRSHPRTGTYG